MRISSVLVAVLGLAIAPLGALGCSATVEVKTASDAPKKKAKKKKVKGEAKKVQAEKDTRVAEMAKAKVKVRDYRFITPKEDELDLNTGVAINFATGKDTLTDDSYEILYEIWSFMEDNPTTRIRVEGNTDDTGDYNQNLDLSARRAWRVYDFLAETGIDVSRLDAVGCGPDNPVIMDTSADARALNRRVDFIIMKDTSLTCGGVYDPAAPEDEGAM
jgi:outer membrane protein OmpA-like peptidoglycan-associated protein